jgi:hypothetical protein
MQGCSGVRFLPHDFVNSYTDTPRWLRVNPDSVVRPFHSKNVLREEGVCVLETTKLARSVVVNVCTPGYEDIPIYGL